MADLRSGQSNQMTKAQRISAAGRAQSSPREKLLAGPRADLRGSALTSRSGPLIVKTQAMIFAALPLLGRATQRLGQSLQPGSWRFNSASGRKFPAHFVLSAVRGFIEDAAAIAAILRLAISNEPDAREKTQRVICLRDARHVRGRPGFGHKTALFLACILLSRPALAQEREVETPIDLFLPESAPGVRVSPGFVLKANAEATFDYDTNIYNVENNRQSDAVAIIRPQAVLASDWSRHAIALVATSEIRRYLDISAEDSEQFELRALSTFDLGVRTTVDAEGGYASLIEPRGTVGDTLFTDRPIEFDKKWIGAQIARTGGTLELIVGGKITTLDYSNARKSGALLDLDYRDVTVREGSVRSNYRISPKVSAFVQVSGNQVDYSEALGFPRNSSGYEVLGGMHLEVSSLVDVEGAVGFLRQDFDDPLAEPAKGATFHLKGSWTPTPRWQVTALGERTVDASPLPTDAAVIHSNFQLTVQRAVSDKVLLQAAAGYVVDDFHSTDRTDRRFSTDLGVSYRLAPRILASVHAGYRTRSSNVPGLSYDGFAVGVTLRATL